MGFDNECILNIQSLAGEYFCPVCRLLVYPNEALQSQCTHLYCKPCLTYVVSTTRACPYDGYLVTEADAKPLVESNKTLAETIGKIAVHCLYHRSGCTWQGPLSECTSHCSGCAFGNSPVVCNRCGTQIVHCQVQEHAQNCPGVQPQAQQAEGAPDTSASGTAATADQTQAATQTGTATSQTQASQIASATIPGAVPNQIAISSSQAQAVVQAAVPTAEQWYQQQYHQYYQQYPGYDPYQQQYQQYYPYQQPAIPQSQQQPLQANPPYGTVQPQPQAYLQPQLQTQPSQSQAQPQPQVQPPLVQAPVAAQTQNQASVNQQLQLQPAAPPHLQIQAQTYPSAHGQAHLPPQAYFQAQSHSQPHPQNVQMPQYQQPQVQQLTQSQPQQNPQLHPSQPMSATVQSQTQHPSSNALTGHHPFPQSHLHQPVLSAVPQQRTMHVQSQGVPNSQSQNHVQTQIQFPQQPPLLRPPQSQTTIPNQQQTALLPSPNIISVQQPPVHSFAQQPGIPVHQRPIMQPVQQLNPQQYFHTPPYVQHKPLTLSQLRPQGQFQSFPQNIRASTQSQQNVVLSQGMQHTQSSNLVGQPMMSSHGILPQPYAQTVGVLPRPMYPAVNHQYTNQNDVVRTNNQVQPGENSRLTITERPAEKEAELSAKNVAHDLGASSAVVADSEVETVKSEVDMKSIDDGNKPSEDKSYQGNTSAKEISESRGGMLRADPQHAYENGESESKPTLKEEGTDSTLEDSSNGKLGELVAEGAKDVTSSGMKQGERKEMPSEEAQLHGVQDRKLQKDPSGTEEGSQTVSTSAAPIGQVQAGSFMQPVHPGSAILQQRPGAPPLLQVPSSGPPHHIQGSGHPLTHVRPQEPGHVPGQPFHLSEHFQPPRGNLGFAASSGSASQHGPYNQSHAPPAHSGAPRGLPFALPPSAFDSHGGIMPRAAPHDHEGQSGQQPSGIISNMLRMNGNPGFDSSSTRGLRDERFKALPGERLNPFPEDPTRVIDRLGFEDDLKQFPRPSYLDSEPVPRLGNYSSRAFDRGPLGVNYDTRLNTDPAAGTAPRFLAPYGHGGIMHASDTGGHPDFGGRRLMDGLAPRSPIRDYPGIPSRGFRGFGPDDFDGREFHRFGDPLAREFHENRFPNLHSHFRRGEFEGPGNMRIDDHMRNDLIGQAGHPGHLRRGEHLGPHNLPSHMHMREHGGFSVHPRHAGPGSFESFFGNRAGHPRLGEPGFRSSFSLPRFPNDGTYTGELESFDHTRKRKPASMGWCRICKVDCETVEGLDVHSQTREHQRMAMDMVRIIKQNAKKQKLASGDQSSVEDANKSKIPVLRAGVKSID